MAPIAPGRRLRQEEPDTGAARVCPARGASGSEGWAVIRAAPSAKRRASGAAAPAIGSGTPVGLIAPANDEGPLVSTCLPAALVSPQEARCLTSPNTAAAAAKLS